VGTGSLRSSSTTAFGERRRVMALQRRLSRCARSSRGREKTRDALASIRSRERRRDFCAQASHQIAAANAVVVLEDLKTRQMTRSAKGTLTAPGRNMRAKSGLSAPSWPRDGTSSHRHSPRRPATPGLPW
jgi:putative transposase